MFSLQNSIDSRHPNLASLLYLLPRRIPQIHELRPSNAAGIQTPENKSGQREGAEGDRCRRVTFEALRNFFCPRGNNREPRRSERGESQKAPVTL
ncbi:hypothetical protein L596_008104 [Steinernema carpocapsae]|uniref:Uncharacterized protein n=1 Tax=Steinernema carpocapsae TaxID=34508 RepID=A0A4U5PCG9_STECR|nr:hypothetical protein L596_008104 [Steinernema carpocapsae]